MDWSSYSGQVIRDDSGDFGDSSGFDRSDSRLSGDQSGDRSGDQTQLNRLFCPRFQTLQNNT